LHWGRWWLQLGQSYVLILPYQNLVWQKTKLSAPQDCVCLLPLIIRKQWEEEGGGRSGKKEGELGGRIPKRIAGRSWLLDPASLWQSLVPNVNGLEKVLLIFIGNKV
jgi:hypothetical protein